MKIKLLWIGMLVFLIPATSAFSFDTISPEEAYERAIKKKHTFILDVRTGSEWKWIGHPGANKLGEGADLEGKVINITSMIVDSCKIYNKLIINDSFLEDVDAVFFDDINKVTLITMCRSGPRGAAAAQILEDAGYDVMNMEEGFQGGTDARGYRIKEGWVFRGLPYSYTGPGYWWLEEQDCEEEE